MTDGIETDARATARKVIDIFVDDRLKNLPLPDAFWEDAYVLGFLMCAAMQMTQGRYGDELEPLAAAEATFQALGDTSGLGADAIKTRVGECQDGGETDYLKAMISADKLVRYVTGSNSMEHDPLIAAVRQQADRMIESGAFGDGEVSSESAMRATLMTTLFTDVVMERFGIAAAGAANGD